MTQSLTLIAEGRIPESVLKEISANITPDYLRRQLMSRHMPDRACPCPECGETLYGCTKPYSKVPTEDWTLRMTSRGDGFLGTASGCQTENRLIVKVMAMQGIQKILLKSGIASSINFSDVEPAILRKLSHYGLRKKS